MARRSVWLVTGAVAGAASTLYAERKVRQAVEAASARMQPDALVSEVGRSARQAARSTGGRVREALATGRSTMQRREQELWADLDAGGALSAPEEVLPVDPLPAAEDGAAAPVPDRAGSPGATTGHTARGRRRGRGRTPRSPSHLGK